MDKKRSYILLITSTIVLPGSGSLYFILGRLFDRLELNGILGGFLIVIFLLNVKLVFFTKDQYDGVVNVIEDPGGVKGAEFIVEGDVETVLLTKETIAFKIKRKDDSLAE